MSDRSGPLPPPIAARERSLAERLLEDETLRGDLDDETWAPVQDWLLRMAARAAAGTDGLDETAAQAVLDRAWSVLKGLVGGLTAALAVGTDSVEFASRVESIAPHLQPPVVDAASGAEVRPALQRVARQLVAAGADGPTTAARLVDVLEPRPRVNVRASHAY